MAHSLENTCRDDVPPVLVPIPLHGARRRSRGYNQSDLLARIMGQTLGWGVRGDVLARVRRTGQQAKLTAVEDRRRNLAGAFRARPAADGSRPTEVVLVDDLVTSGATLLSARRTLTTAGWPVRLAVGAGCARGGGNSPAPVDTPAGDF
jgi:predicted amidophosphoribosyltransferase